MVVMPKCFFKRLFIYLFFSKNISERQCKQQQNCNSKKIKMQLNSFLSKQTLTVYIHIIYYWFSVNNESHFRHDMLNSNSSFIDQDFHVSAKNRISLGNLTSSPIKIGHHDTFDQNAKKDLI